MSARRRRRRQRHLLIPKSNYLALEMSQKWFRTHQILCFIARIIIDSICILRSSMKECELEISRFVLCRKLSEYFSKFSLFCFYGAIGLVFSASVALCCEKIYTRIICRRSHAAVIAPTQSTKVDPGRRLNCLILPSMKVFTYKKSIISWFLFFFALLLSPFFQLRMYFQRSRRINIIKLILLSYMGGRGNVWVMLKAFPTSCIESARETYDITIASERTKNLPY